MPFLRKTSAAEPRNGALPTSASNRTAPDAVPVRRRRRSGSRRLLRRHVRGRAHDGVRVLGVLARAGQIDRHAEVEQDHAALGGDEDVRRLDVPMKLAGGVERLHAQGKLAQRGAQSLGVRGAPGSYVRHDVHAVHELHREEDLVLLGGDELVEPHEVRMVDVGGRPELLLEAVQGRGAEVPEPLDCDGRSALLVERLEDRPHPAGADAPPDAIPRGARPAGEPRRKLGRGLRCRRSGHRPSDPVRGKPLDAGARGLERRRPARCGVLADPPTLAGYRGRHTPGARVAGSSRISRSPPYTRSPSRTARRRRGDARGRARDRGRR